jgi:hypothetical protein
MNVNAIKCPSCQDVIYSRARHDMRACSCGDVAIDGGFDYVKVCFKDNVPERLQLNLSVSKKELYEDWNSNEDKYGLIKNAD